jgi:hypothetical protein
MYTEEEKNNIFEIIIQEIENGKALRNVLKQDNMPSTQTFYKWLTEDEFKSKHYACACELRADILFEEILEIADDSKKDTIITDQGITIDNEFVQRSRIKIDARKWMLGKMQPKKYGDKIDVTSSGNELKPIVINLGTGIDPRIKDSEITD